jgi:CO dehydrogenase nickel-insertion accessory protein CooC1
MPTIPCYYDDSLRRAVDVVRATLSTEAEQCTYLRDGQGRMHVYVSPSISVEETEKLEEKLRTALAGYAPSFGPIVKNELPSGEPSFFIINEERVRYIERRFAGVDWTREPSPLATPPRLVFYSIKGGVGRTTALTILATALATKGSQVLVVDLDLEAPGLGSVLLTATDLPEFGALDWLVEEAVQHPNSPSLSQVVGTSAVARNFGRIDVVPAFGRRCLENPTGILSKLSRVVVEGGTPGRSSSFGTRVSEFIDRLGKTRHYDCILIDARAGLSEISAAPLLSLGADLLFFMSDSSQSFATYAALLAHLQRFAPIHSDSVGDDDWRLRIKAVRGRVGNPGDPRAAAIFNDRCYEVFSETIYDKEGATYDASSFTFDPDDPEAPHSPIQIVFDPRYQTFEPLTAIEQGKQDVFTPAFGAFIEWCSNRMRIGPSNE